MNKRSEMVEKALALLHATPSSRTAAPSMPSSDWAAKWTQLAQMTSGLDADDPRLTPVLKGLAACQHCHDRGDLDGFTQAAARVRRLMQFTINSKIYWHGSQEHRLTALGPATVEHVHCDGGKLYVFVVWHDLGRWVSESIVTEIREPR